MKSHLIATASIFCATLAHANGEEIFQGTNLSPDVKLLLIILIAALIFSIIFVFCCYCIGNWCPWLTECFGSFGKKASEDAQAFAGEARAGAQELAGQASSTISEAAQGIADAASDLVPSAEADAEAAEPADE